MVSSPSQDFYYIWYHLPVLCSTFHFISGCSLLLTCFSPAPLSISSHLHLSSQTQLFWLDTSCCPYNSIPDKSSVTYYLPSCCGERPSSSAVFPYDTFALPLVLCANLIPDPYGWQLSWVACVWQSRPRCRDVFSPPREPTAFSDFRRVIAAPWLQWTERRCSKQGCSCIQARAGGWVWFFLLPSRDPISLFDLLQKSLAFPGRLRSVSHTHSSHPGAAKLCTQLPLTVLGCHQQQWEGHCAQLLWQQPGRMTYPANLEAKPHALYFLHNLGQVQLPHNPYWEQGSPEST